MKTISVKAVSVLLLVFLAGSLLAACGGGTENAGGASGKPDVTDEPVNITFYRPHTATTEDEFMDLMGNAIKAKFPNVTLKFIPFGTGTGMEDVLGTGQDLDIVLLSIGFVPEYTNFNLEFDMNDMIKESKFDLKRLEPTTVDFIQKYGNGKMIALPIFTTAATLMYNKDLFDKFGVAYPKAGMTWDEAFELAKKLTRTEGGTQYYGFGTSVGHMFRVNQLSLPFVDTATNKATINTDAFRKMAENFARFYRIPGAEFTNDMLKKQADMFIKDRTLAMYAYFNSTMVGAPEDMHLDAVPLPSFPEAMGVGSQMYPTFAGVASISKHKEMAFRILTYLTSDEMQMKFAKDGLGLPIVKKPDIIQAFGGNKPGLEGKNIAAFYPDKPAAIAMKSEYDSLSEKEAGTAFNEIALGQKDAVTAFREAAERADQNIESAKAK